MNTDLGVDAKRAQQDEQQKIDDAEELTEEEQEEKESLLQQVLKIFTRLSCSIPKESSFPVFVGFHKLVET